MTTALEKTDRRDTEIVVAGMTRTQIDVIKRTIAKDLNDDELRLFLYQAERSGLDPLARQIYAFKADGRVSIGAYIDGLRLLADRTGHYAPGRQTTFTFAPDGQPETATAYVMKWIPVAGEWFEVSETAHYDEQVRNGRDGKPLKTWRTMPKIMLAKCAEAKALRRAFPANLSGLKEESELPSLAAAAPLQYEPAPTVNAPLTPEQRAALEAPTLPPHPAPEPRHEPPAPPPTTEENTPPPPAQEPTKPPRRKRRTRCKLCGELKHAVEDGACSDCRAPAHLCTGGCGAAVETDGGKCPDCATAALKPPARPGGPPAPGAVLKPSERVVDAIREGTLSGRFTQAEAMEALKADPDVADDHEQWTHAHADAAIRVLNALDKRGE